MSHKLADIQSLLKQAESGDANAQTWLGRAYQIGMDRVKINYDEAFKWLSIAAKQGNGDAFCFLSYAYINGMGVKKSQKLAFETASETLKNGHAKANYYIGLIYEEGFVDGSSRVPKDTNKAQAHFREFLKAYPIQTDDTDPENQYLFGRIYMFGRGVEKNEAIGFDWILKAAIQGHAVAQESLAFIYYKGLGVPKNLRFAYQWFLKSATQGDAASQCSLGVMYSLGEHVNIDLKKGFELTLLSANQNCDGAQQQLGAMYEHGKGVEKDLKKAFEWYHKAAEQGNIKACISLGVYYEQGHGGNKDLKQAFDWMQKAAEAGNATAEYNLGIYYTQGTGVTKDDKLAAEYFKRSANQNNIDACKRLKHCYEKGIGVVTDLAQAFAWNAKAAEAGDAEAQWVLGDAYFESKGVVKDETKAVAWYERSAKQGNKNAQFDLGWCYEHGRGGVFPNPYVARSWYLKSAKQGHPRAQANLAYMMFMGNGGPQKRKGSFYWNYKSASQGESTAQSNLAINYNREGNIDVPELEAYDEEGNRITNSVYREHLRVKWFLEASKRNFNHPQLGLPPFWAANFGVTDLIQHFKRELDFEKASEKKTDQNHVRVNFLNKRQKNGDTPLHVALYRKQIDYAIALIRCGASLTVDNMQNKNDTPLIMILKEPDYHFLIPFLLLRDKSLLPLIEKHFESYAFNFRIGLRRDFLNNLQHLLFFFEEKFLRGIAYRVEKIYLDVHQQCDDFSFSEDKLIKATLASEQNKANDTLNNNLNLDLVLTRKYLDLKSLKENVFDMQQKLIMHLYFSSQTEVFAAIFDLLMFHDNKGNFVLPSHYFDEETNTRKLQCLPSGILRIIVNYFTDLFDFTILESEIAPSVIKRRVDYMIYLIAQYNEEIRENLADLATEANAASQANEATLTNQATQENKADTKNNVENNAVTRKKKSKKDVKGNVTTSSKLIPKTKDTEVVILCESSPLKFVSPLNFVFVREEPSTQSLPTQNTSPQYSSNVAGMNR